MITKGLGSTDSETVKNQNTCTIKKVLRIAGKSEKHRSALIAHYMATSKKTGKGTVGYRMAQGYLSHLLFENHSTENDNTATVTETPKVVLEDGEPVQNLLLRFYRALGWNGTDLLDPRKIRVSKETYYGLFDEMYRREPHSRELGGFMVNFAPGTDDSIPPEITVLLDGWAEPDTGA